jgi:hypothetical protein
MIHHRRGYWQVRVYAGLDPRSGRMRHVYDCVTSLPLPAPSKPACEPACAPTSTTSA